MPTLTIRAGEETDVPRILDFCRQLAIECGIPESFTATSESIRSALGCLNGDPLIHILVGEENGNVVAYVSYMPHYSTVKGERGVFMDNLYVKPECRGKGYAQALIAQVVDYAASIKGTFIEWFCPTSNEASVRFYTKLGAQHFHNLSVFQLKLEEFCHHIKNHVPSSAP
eukprot:Gregarina_sp_Poly_1__2543@NODE_168_length_12074_cov_98_169901_g149_i0_p9_GENE_NODE_168_length_12074_cov_98_169901_g149_i0NODE_168_length_12074_cov_98_169901_g149_i0_p9_ORF_typecomplete_len170_score10_06Acetyltransf_1/PF00583_25/2_1e19Acetyltransf_10/PF13673_7/4_2e14Acetyltransf_4/PF13420_7/1_5e11Acetyltransf_7/PF13508_7/2_1e11FR47/PF08445_10/2_2e10Acetyltransf_3/PF13302_7/1_9e10GNAT_acetyltran/PF12746_7/2_5e09Acetyltransf_9/PF13527_7/1_7e08Acetyltransf_CG/PF14542_6/6_8e07Acetyltransf_8/PF13523_6